MNLFVAIMLAVLLATDFSASVFAGTCEIQYTRTACVGKESISYKKCSGKEVCSKFKEAESVDECRALAIKSCSNKRLSITKSKIINAFYNEKIIATVGGYTDFCKEYKNREKEFNKCE
ncbi:hypothetical protein [Oceanicoccus sp. KOV_DT_Chl]|uniref:hypothetical protein n=1 Tax=Oceanicoccus sp. KOV_DT_Chl TaxID=1904639 RepID=UPI000C7A029F|nr:hypothetical protein [Oceanicoccus sp. KOV_DT_Chl]